MKSATLLFACALLVSAKEPPRPGNARVLSQNFQSSYGGVYVAPIGPGLYGVPIYGRSNIVVLDVGVETLEIQERGERHIVLPVGGMIRFVRIGATVEILDSDNRKHKFSITGQRMRPRPVGKPLDDGAY